MNYFEKLLEKNENIKLIEEKKRILMQSISVIEIFKDRLITIGEVELNNTDILRELIQ